jgi:nucleotide-binding universal stress UspA family protein
MVLPSKDDDFFIDGKSQISIQEGKRKLSELSSRFDKDSVKMMVKVQSGNIIDEIIRASTNPKCKLIVLGFKGISRIGNFKLGSISGEVAKRAKVPVLIIK